MNNITFNQDKYYLGKLCLRGHDWNETGKSLRSKNNCNCMKCLSEKAKEYRNNNKDKVSASNRKYVLKNRLKINERNRKKYNEDPETARRKAKAYRDKNREKVREWDRNHYKKNRLNILLRRKEWNKENKDKLINFRRSYNGRLASKKAGYKRKSLKLSNHHYDYTIQEVKQRLQDFDSSCAYCGSSSKVTLDHFIPLSKGGPDCIGNLIPACSYCNTSKHARDVYEWYQEKEFYSVKKWRKILKVLGKVNASYNQIPLF